MKVRSWDQLRLPHPFLSSLSFSLTHTHRALIPSEGPNIPSPSSFLLPALSLSIRLSDSLFLPFSGRLLLSEAHNNLFQMSTMTSAFDI